MEAINAHSEELDDLVHDVASSVASNVNNSGVDDQVNFILESGDESQLEACYDVMLQARDNAS